MIKDLSENKYDPAEIEPKWQKIWEKERIYQPDLKQAKKPFYNLMMFPYPSAEGLHVGNMYAFTGADIYGRFKRMQGFDVFEPIGLDGFGIHSENYALKIGKHPVKQAKISQKNFYRQLRLIGNGFAWENKLETYDPDYYKWTQWLFVQLYKNKLAYRKKAPVNWCPSCKTVLSDEQVEGGVCERCKTAAETKELEQWFFNITKYADRLLKNLDKIDWTPKVKEMQKNWIGRSEGAEIRFPLDSSNSPLKSFKESIRVFTTRLDTLFGATALVLAPEHPTVEKFMTEEVHKYIEASKRKSEIQRQEGKEKTGVFTGSCATNPVNGERLPIWVADYVLIGYGEGAIMLVPAHDERDFEFAKKHGIEIREVVKAVNDGILINSGKYSGLPSEEAQTKMLKDGQKEGWAEKRVNYHLRDWLISRQRYWAPPIPIIYCHKCWEIQSSKFKDQSEEGKDYIIMDDKKWLIQPVPEEDLPVELPYIENWKPLGTGKSPLAAVEDWVSVKCPKCGGAAKRETDVSDTFLDSAWYFLRYPSTNSENSTLKIGTCDLKIPWNQQITRRWLPVDMYIGGAEHSVLHLLYSRFITMVLQDLKLLDFEEPYKKFRAHGLLISEGSKMSKSKGNVINPDEYIKRYGADTLRMYLMFIGPFQQGGDFQDKGVRGIVRFLNKVWKLLHKGEAPKDTSGDLLKKLHQTIKKVGEDIQELKYNTAISALMELVNVWEKGNLSKSDAESFIKLLAPFAPHITEELWQYLEAASSFKPRASIHLQAWPEYDSDLVKEKDVVIPVQINGKLRDQITLSSDKATKKEAVKAAALKSGKTQKYTKGKEIKKVVFVKGRLINFVVD